MKEERVKVSSLRTLQDGRSTLAFRKIDLKEENYKKQRKNQLLEMAGITEALVPKEPKGENQWYPEP